MAPKSKTKKTKQHGGDDIDAKLQHAVTTLNELAASLSAVLESRGVSVPETPAVEETPAAAETPVEDTPIVEETLAAEEPVEGGGKKKKAAAKKAAPKKK